MENSTLQKLQSIYDRLSVHWEQQGWASPNPKSHPMPKRADVGDRYIQELLQSNPNLDRAWVQYLATLALHVWDLVEQDQKLSDNEIAARLQYLALDKGFTYGSYDPRNANSI